MALYLYGIVEEKERSCLAGMELVGMGGAPVLCHWLPPYGVVYSDTTEERYLASRANLLTHERVLESLMKLIPNDRAVPLPLQFGLVVDDWTQVQEQLIAPYGDRLGELLAKLVGRCEVGVKIFWKAEEELNWLVTQDPVLTAKRADLAGKILSMDEAIAIGQELESALEQRQKLIVNTFLGELLPLAVEYAEGELLTDNMVFNGSFLIESAEEPQFGQKVEQLDQHFENRYRIRYNNFTAPYNFVGI
jgi:hypothetical protein